MIRIKLDTESQTPMYEQIYQSIKLQMKDGILPPNTKLPSTRSLAENLGISRNTIDLAYSQLVSEGYLYPKAKSGYYTSQISLLTSIDKKNSSALLLIQEHKKTYQYDFSPFSIDINNFPYNTWRKLSKDAMNECNHHLFLLGDSQGDYEFRNAISDYLKSFRQVNCNEERIIIGAGADYLLQLLCQILNIAAPSSSIAMENPTYKRAYRIFSGFHYPVAPIPLDENGINIQELKASSTNIAYVTPSHQYPLGVIMPIQRRLELLQWANDGEERYIIEDDHDSEFRYKGKPIPSLQGIDTKEKVIYMGTFSRALTPAIRIAYMVLPEKLYRIYKENFYYYSSTVSRVDQYILTNFIKEGYFERHFNKMRKIYKSKHDTMLKALKIFGNSIEIKGENAGLHLVVSFHTEKNEASTFYSEEEILRLAEENSIKLYTLSRHYIHTNNRSHQPTFLLGYANLLEKDIEEGVAALYSALNEQ